MFGRMRAPSTSLDTLERPASKLLKDDSLSVYEATLMKLKLGSQKTEATLMKLKLGSQKTSTPVEEAAVVMESDSESTISMESTGVELRCSKRLVARSPDVEAMAIDTESSSASVQLSSSSCQSLGDPKQQHSSPNVSVLYMFSKYKNSRHASAPSSCETMRMVCDDSPIASSSGCWPSLSSNKERTDLKCLSSSSSVCQT